MMPFSFAPIVRGALERWPEPAPKAACDLVFVGAHGHGHGAALATAELAAGL